MWCTGLVIAPSNSIFSCRIPDSACRVTCRVIRKKSGNPLRHGAFRGDTPEYTTRDAAARNRRSASGNEVRLQPRTGEAARKRRLGRTGSGMGCGGAAFWLRALRSGSGRAIQRSPRPTSTPPGRSVPFSSSRSRSHRGGRPSCRPRASAGRCGGRRSRAEGTRRDPVPPPPSETRR